ncbi:MAG: tRNA (adenosine(37)-N6)-dimethylallyltransferase MiaA [Erysipelotrichaceae bacterium]|nr:tRNA (adenosine(37)-N6)-dimethylallyltransferase MiaA [Erysipelotrichaceae bacterium]
MKKVVVIIGPTAVGKTALSLAVAEHFKGEIISGDSIQVYRELNIGSAKLPLEEQRNIPHHLIDIRNLDASYNVADFQKECRLLITDITAKGHLPIITGGTGFYIKAALFDYIFEDEDIETAADQTGWADFTNEELHARLMEADPLTAGQIHPHNRKRLIRALEMVRAGHQRSTVLAQQKHEMIYDAYLIGLTLNREELYQRIDRRVDQMMDSGLQEEVRQLREKNPGLFDYQSMQGIGYREWQAYYNGQASVDAVIAEIKKHSRQFAKRQYTWFNNQLPVNWYDIEDDMYLVKINNDLTRWFNE